MVVMSGMVWEHTAGCKGGSGGNGGTGGQGESTVTNTIGEIQVINNEEMG